MLQKGKIERPFTGSKIDQGNILGLEVAGNKIRKGHKVAEKYTTKPNLKPMSPNKEREQFSRTTTQQPEQIQQEFEDNFMSSDTKINKFQTYMDVMMVNPQYKEVYKEMKVNDQLRKVTSKPFSKNRMTSSSSNQSVQSTPQTSQSNQKQTDLATILNNGSQLSQGSTKVSSNQGASSKGSHNQKMSQDLAGFEKELSQTVQSKTLNQPNKNKNPFKLNQMVKVVDCESQPEQENIFLFKPEQWTIKDQQTRQHLQAIVQSKMENIQILQTHLKEWKAKNVLPKNYDKVVQHTISKIRDHSDVQSQRSELEDSQSIQHDAFDIDEQVRDLDLELADQEIINQKMKLKKLNEMMEESVDDLSNMSVEDYRQRALFLTDIGRHSMQQSQVKKENSPEKIDEQSDNEDELQMEIQKHKTPKQDAFFIQKNKKLAWATAEEQLEILSQCNKLPEEGKKRLEELMEGIENFNNSEEEFNKLLKAPNPFKQEPTEELDNKIQHYLSEFDENDVRLNEGVLDMNVLPKDKALRDEAAERILQQKLQQVNEQILDIINQEKSGQIDKIKVQGICEKNRQMFDYTPSEFLNLKLKQFNYVAQMEQEEQKLLQKLEQDKDILNEIKSLRQYYDETIYKMNNITYDQNDKVDQEEFRKIKEQIKSQRIHNIDEIQPDPLVLEIL